jgi:hypothetical protein
MKKKNHFDAFRHEKHFEKQPQSHSQTGIRNEWAMILCAFRRVVALVVYSRHKLILFGNEMKLMFNLWTPR